jgi:nucleoid-associated protein YgaU
LTVTLTVAVTVAAIATLSATLSQPARAQSDVIHPGATLQGSAGAAMDSSTTVGEARVELTDDAPDKHVVVRGDTLWDISARFLKSPWLWPQVWDLNRDQIQNPHLIYPGNIVYLDRSGAAPRLRLGRAVGENDDSLAASGGAGQSRLEPAVRALSLGKDAIPTLSMGAIEAFINRPLIVDAKGLSESPRIMATQEGRVYLGRGDRAYVRGIRDEKVSEWHVYRPAKPLVDPDSRQTLAYEALYLGTAHMTRKGDPATVVITGTAEEIGEGDRLVPAEAARTVNFAPRAPEREVAGKIISVYRGVSQVGRNSVVALNVGKKNGLEVGHVMSVQLSGRVVKDRETNETVTLPNEPIGQLLVFRTFDTISYGLIVDASQSISVGDSVKNP